MGGAGWGGDGTQWGQDLDEPSLPTAESVGLSSALFPCSNRAALHLYSNTLNFQ